MAEPQLSVRSAQARDIAHRLARRGKRSIADGRRLATRGLTDFRVAGLELISPWEF